MYIRLKRRNQTLFLHVEPSNSFGQIKQRIADVLNMPDPNRIQLLANDRVSIFPVFSCCWLTWLQKRELVDLATVSDQEIKTDDIVYMIFAKDGGGGWEELQVDQLASFGDEGSGASSR